MDKTKLKNVGISADKHQRLKELAAREGKSMREIAEELIQKELEKNARNRN